MTQNEQPRILSIMLGRGSGGLENVFIDHAMAFAKLGYQSYALCHKGSSLVPRLSAQNAVPFFTTPSASLYNPLAWSKIIRTIRQVRPDVICLHANSASSFCTSPVMKTFIRPFPKLMATTHNNRNKRFYRLDGIFSITQVLKDDLIQRFHIDSNKIFTCPNAAPLPQEISESKPHLPIRIGFLGRLEPVKGCDFLLKACLSLKNEKVPFHLVIAGDGSARPEYQEFVKQNNLSNEVSFVGWTTDKARFFEGVDFMCIPSRSEAQPLTLLESLSYGKPTIISSCHGMMEVIAPFSAGLTFPIGDTDKLTQQLKALIQNPDRWADLSQRARQTYLKYYTPEAQKQNLARGIQSLLHNSR